MNERMMNDERKSQRTNKRKNERMNEQENIAHVYLLSWSIYYGRYYISFYSFVLLVSWMPFHYYLHPPSTIVFPLFRAPLPTFSLSIFISVKQISIFLHSSFDWQFLFHRCIIILYFQFYLFIFIKYSSYLFLFICFHKIFYNFYSFLKHSFPLPLKSPCFYNDNIPGNQS